MAQKDLIPMNKRTEEEQKKITTMGGIASGKARQKKALLRESLQAMLNNNINLNNTSNEAIQQVRDRLKLLGLDTSKLSVNDLVNAGLILGAVFGNANNYRTILETTGQTVEQETATPTLSINIVDNSNLEKTLYEANKPKNINDEQ